MKCSGLNIDTLPDGVSLKALCIGKGISAPEKTISAPLLSYSSLPLIRSRGSSNGEVGYIVHTKLGDSSLSISHSAACLTTFGAIVKSSDSSSGQHLGIILVELGVGITVATVMIALYHSFASFRIKDD